MKRQRRNADLFFADLMGPRSVPLAGASQARLHADRFLADLLGESAPEREVWADAAEDDEAALRRKKVAAFFDQLKKDLKSLDIDISGVDLLDMQQHAQFAKLKMFNAWLNSAKELYVNIDDGFSKLRTALGGNKRMAELLYATVLVRHELNHVQQFKDAGGPPKSYRDMCVFERDAYAGDAKWMKDKRAALKKLGLTDAVIDSVISSQETNSKAFARFAKLGSEPDIKKELIYVPTEAQAQAGDGRPFLPPHDKLPELYKAK